MRSALIALLLASVAFAGCSDDPSSSDPTATSTNTTTGTTTGTTTTTTGTTTTGTQAPGNETPENKPPTLVFTSDLAQGAAPLTVQFSITVSDADDDALSWVLSGLEGDDITGSESGNHSATFTAEGTYTTTLNVTDGTHFVDANITITVAAAAAEVPGPIVYSGSSIGTPLGCLVYDGDPYFYYDGDLAGVWQFSVAETPTGGDVVTEWWNGDSSAGDMGASGVIPSPSDNVAVCSSLPEPFSFTMTLHHPDYVA